MHIARLLELLAFSLSSLTATLGHEGHHDLAVEYRSILYRRMCSNSSVIISPCREGGFARIFCRRCGAEITLRAAYAEAKCIIVSVSVMTFSWQTVKSGDGSFVVFASPWQPLLHNPIRTTYLNPHRNTFHSFKCYFVLLRHFDPWLA